MAFFISAEHHNIFLQLTPQAVEDTLVEHNKLSPEYIVISSFSTAVLIFEDERKALKVWSGNGISSLDLWVSTPQDIAKAIGYTSAITGRDFHIGEVDTAIFQRFLLQLLAGREYLDAHWKRPAHPLYLPSVQDTCPARPRIFVSICDNTPESSPILQLPPCIASPAASSPPALSDIHRTSSEVSVTPASTVPGNHLNTCFTPTAASQSASPLAAGLMLLASTDNPTSPERENQLSPFQIVSMPTPELERAVHIDNATVKTKKVGRRKPLYYNTGMRSSVRLIMKSFACTGRMGGLSLRLSKASAVVVKKQQV